MVLPGGGDRLEILVDFFDGGGTASASSSGRLKSRVLEGRDHLEGREEEYKRQPVTRVWPQVRGGSAHAEIPRTTRVLFAHAGV